MEYIKMLKTYISGLWEKMQNLFKGKCISIYMFYDMARQNKYKCTWYAGKRVENKMNF